MRITEEKDQREWSLLCISIESMLFFGDSASVWFIDSRWTPLRLFHSVIWCLLFGWWTAWCHWTRSFARIVRWIPSSCAPGRYKPSWTVMVCSKPSDPQEIFGGSNTYSPGLWMSRDICHFEKHSIILDLSTSPANKEVAEDTAVELKDQLLDSLICVQLWNVCFFSASRDIPKIILSELFGGHLLSSLFDG